METEDPEETKEWLTTGEVASMLMVSDTTIRTWVKKGYLECRLTLGGHRRFNKDDVERLKNNKKPVIGRVFNDEKIKERNKKFENNPTKSTWDD